MTDNMNQQVEKHSMLQSIVLHLFPGVCIGLAYFLLVTPVTNAGYPTAMALIIAGVFVLIPLELGLVWRAKVQQKDDTYEGTVLNRTPISPKEYVLWIVSVILVAGVIFAVMEPVANGLRDSIFGWIPETHWLDLGYSEEYSVTTLTITYTLGFLFLAVIAPIVEEVYFRGYLLPRIPDLKGYSGILHSFLFAVYHMWTPWMILTRTIGFYPFVFAVQKKHNIYISIIAHILVNTIDFVVGFVFIFSLL